MKDFPRFSQATINFSLPQPQAKLLLLAVSSFKRKLRSLLDINISDKQLQDFFEADSQNYNFTFPPAYKDKEKLIHDYEQMMDSLSDSFYLPRYALVEKLEHELTAFYQDNFDPEILNLAKGELIRVANND